MFAWRRASSPDGRTKRAPPEGSARFGEAHRRSAEDGRGHAPNVLDLDVGQRSRAGEEPAAGVELLSAGIDEVPGVYKDIHGVMAAQTDLVEVLGEFRPRIVKMCPEGPAED